MSRIERPVEIDRPSPEVFALLTDLDRLAEWATIVVGTRDVSDFRCAKAAPSVRHCAFWDARSRATGA